jgi:hypothetical protein
MQEGHQQVNVSPELGIVVFLLFIAYYIWICVSISKIAKNTHNELVWMSWIPILQMVPLIKASEKPTWWILLFLIPYVNLVAIPWMFICLAEKVGRPGWTGLLVLVPFANLFVIPYFSASKKFDPSL